jgi:hypothetical protein
VQQDAFDPDKESTVDFSVLREKSDELCNVGEWKDVFCTRNEIYYEAQIVKLVLPQKEGLPTKARFHFKGWSKGLDEWIDVGSGRIAPHHLHTNATVKDVRLQEKWQGKNIVGAKVAAKVGAKRDSSSSGGGGGGENGGGKQSKPGPKSGGAKRKPKKPAAKPAAAKNNKRSKKDSSAAEMDIEE